MLQAHSSRQALEQGEGMDHLQPLGLAQQQLSGHLETCLSKGDHVPMHIQAFPLTIKLTMAFPRQQSRTHTGAPFQCRGSPQGEPSRQAWACLLGMP